MKNYKIIKYRNGIGKEFYCVKKRTYFFFWTFLKFAKNVNINVFGQLTSEAYMFDSYERAENLVNRIKENGISEIIKGELVSKL